MAPLRSSRSTRNQDHQAAARGRGVVDLDPTEGLPVQKWEQVTTRVNQELSGDPNATVGGGAGASMTSSAEWQAQFNTPQYPWPELPLPSFFSQLSPLNQELLRRSRCPNTNPTMSEWDRKTNTWISGAEIERQQRALKEEHGKPHETANANQDSQPANGDHSEHEEDVDREERINDDMEMDHEEDNTTATIAAPQAKRRRNLAPEERAFDVKKWAQVPFDVAEKTEERKFLADRRPGMPSLYGGSYQNKVFQPLGLSQSGYTAYGTSNAAYDLGDGGGLGTAVTQDQPAVPPVRKNMPPKRKKKKGGPGRKKANPNPTEASGSAFNGASGGTDTNNGPAASSDGSALNTQDVIMQDVNDEGSDSGDSEGDGSEEGEIGEEMPMEIPPAIESEAIAPVTTAVENTITPATPLAAVPEIAPAPVPGLESIHESEQQPEAVSESNTDPGVILEPELVSAPVAVAEMQHEPEQSNFATQAALPKSPEPDTMQIQPMPDIPVASPPSATIPVTDLLAEPPTVVHEEVQTEAKEDPQPLKANPEPDLLGGLEEQVNKDLAS